MYKLNIWEFDFGLGGEKSFFFFFVVEEEENGVFVLKIFLRFWKRNN